MIMNIRYYLVLIVLTTLLSAHTVAQSPLQKYVGAEAGICFISAKMPEMEFIRGDIPAYPGGYSSTYLKSFMNKSYAGIKAEFLSVNNRFGFSSGLRYIQMNSSVGRNTYWAGNTNYFYLMYLQEGVNTEYLKVKELDQRTSYLGIPLEARFFPYNARLFRVYFKLGADVGFKLQSRTDVVFYNQSMDYLEDEVADLIGRPESVSASLTVSAGVRIGRASKPAINLEAGLPTIFLTSGTSGLVNPLYGGGFQVSFQLPVKPKTK